MAPLLLQLRRRNIIKAKEYKKEDDRDLREIQEKLGFKSVGILLLVEEHHHRKENPVHAEEELHRGTWRWTRMQNQFVVHPAQVCDAPGRHSATH